MQDTLNYRQVFESAGAGLLVLQDNIIIDCNARAAELFQTTPADLTGRPILKLSADLQLTGRPAEEDLEGYLQSAAAGGARAVPWLYRNVNGRPFRARTSFNLLAGTRDTFILTLAHQSFTEREPTDSVDHDHELQSDANAVATLDAKFNVTFVNKRFLELWGYTSEKQVLGRPALDFWELTADYDEVRRQFLTSGTWLGEVPARHRNGQTFPVDLSATRIQTDPTEPSMLMITCIDISERKSALAELRRLVDMAEAATDVISTATPDGKIIFMNRAGMQLLGWTAGETHLISEAHPDWAAEFIQTTGLPMAISAGTWFGETAVLDVNGNEIPVSQLIMAHHDEHGELEFLSTIIRDISEQKAIEAERLQMLEFHRQMERIDEVIRREHDLEQMLHSVMETLREALDCDRAWIMFPNDPAAEYFTIPVEAHRPEYPGASKLGTRIPNTGASSSAMQAALESEDPVVMTTDDGHYLDDEMARKFDIKSLMFIGLHPKTGKPWQMGVHQCSHPRQWTDQEKYLLKAASQRLADGLTSLLIKRDLEENKQRFELAAQCASDLIFELDIESRQVKWFGNIALALGYENGTFNPNADVLLEHIYEKDVQQLVDDIDNNARPGATLSGEYRIRMMNGNLRHWVLHGTFIEIKDRLSLIGVCTDITEQRQAEEDLRSREERYRLLAENVTDVIWIADLDGRMQYISPSVQRLQGISVEESLHNNLFDSITPASAQMAQERLGEELMRDAEPGMDPNRSATMEVEVVHKDGYRVWTEATVSFLRDQDGRAVKLLGITRDISDRKRAEAERQRIEEHLRQNQKLEAIGTLAGGIAHDFNNILFAILGNAELAMDDIPAEYDLARENIENIIAAGRRATGLIEQILSFSRQAEINKAPMQVGPVIDEVLRMVRSTQPANIEIIKSILSPDSTIIGDPTQVHQVVLNLCNNACQSMVQSGGRLEVSQQSLELNDADAVRFPHLSQQRYVKVTVSDTGSGMSPEVTSRVFEPFFTTKPKGKGTGLGLAVAHGIITAMGGAIGVESTEGEGTIFTIMLPASDLEIAQKAREETELLTGEERILVIDDEDSIIQVLKVMLARLGYSITAFTSSTEALAAFQADPDAFDLVITDQTMPVITGDKLAREIIKVRPELPVILCTGYSEIVSPEKADQLGIRHYLHKPFTRESLCWTIREVLDQGLGGS